MLGLRTFMRAGINRTFIRGRILTFIRERILAFIRERGAFVVLSFLLTLEELFGKHGVFFA
jgi:hypothetical protein